MSSISAGEHRATHPKLERALERLRDADLAEPCRQPAPPQLRQAVAEFNAGEFFEQHETLELLWRATPEEVRHLYEGILQVGVGFHHLFVNHNFHGAAVKLDHGARLLEALPPVCQGVDVARLRTDARSARGALLALGPDQLDRFDRALVPKVHFVDADHA
jgi:predicted metal-dependent hydrolase